MLSNSYMGSEVDVVRLVQEPILELLSTESIPGNHARRLKELTNQSGGGIQILLAVRTLEVVF